MSIVVGSLRDTTSGRKRKKITTNRRKKFEPGIVTTRENPLAAKAREDRNKYPSRDFGGAPTNKERSVEVGVSKQFTIAPAYNKGAYQVISRSQVKNIGK